MADPSIGASFRDPSGYIFEHDGLIHAPAFGETNVFLCKLVTLGANSQLEFPPGHILETEVPLRPGARLLSA